MAGAHSTIYEGNMFLLQRVDGPVIFVGNPNGSNPYWPYPQSPIHFAATNVHDNVKGVEVLVHMGANVNIQDRSNRQTTALNLAALAANVKIVEFLLNHGADVNLSDAYGNTALHNVVCRRMDKKSDSNIVQRRLTIINLLLNRGADVNAHTIDDITPLITAADENGAFEIVQRLLVAGADVHVKDNKDHMTCLHYVLSHPERTDMMIAVIKAGASIYDRDIYGSDAIDYIIISTEHCRHQKIKELEELIKIVTLVHQPNKMDFRPDRIPFVGVEEFVDNCYLEVTIMDLVTFSNASSLCDFALRGEGTSGILDEIFMRVVRGNIVIYKDYLLARFEKTYLVDRLCETGFYVITNLREIRFKVVVIRQFCEVLSKEDVFNILKVYINSPSFSE